MSFYVYFRKTMRLTDTHGLALPEGQRIVAVIPEYPATLGSVEVLIEETMED